jgi:hypothetical protein
MQPEDPEAAERAEQITQEEPELFERWMELFQNDQVRMHV